MTLSRTPPALLAIVAILSVQFGNAIAGSLFDAVGPLGAAILRMGLAALILGAIVRPRVRGWDRRTWWGVVALGAGLAGMNALIYLSIASIPIGVAVTIELLGPLAVAVAGTRRWRDLTWVVLAAIAVALLGIDGEGDLALEGVLFAAGAGVFWALYIVASSRLGPRARGVDGLAVAMVIAAVLVAPWGVGAAVRAVALDPLLLLAFAGVAVMTSSIPYALEFLALKRMPTRVFGVLSSLGPAVAALAGLLVLGQSLSPSQLVAIVIVMVACAGAIASSRSLRMRISSSAPPAPLIPDTHDGVIAREEKTSRPELGENS
jgi:inner membrane transporter RhtA